MKDDCTDSFFSRDYNTIKGKMESTLISSAAWRWGYLFTPFPSITLSTQHLAVGLYGSAALTPWSDMVALHLLKREFLLAVGADVVLLFPYCELDVFGE